MHVTNKPPILQKDQNQNFEIDFFTPKSFDGMTVQPVQKTNISPNGPSLTNESCSDDTKSMHNNHKGLEDSNAFCDSNIFRQGKIGLVRKEGLPKEITFDEWRNCSNTDISSAFKTNSQALTVTPSSMNANSDLRGIKLNDMGPCIYLHFPYSIPILSKIF